MQSKLDSIKETIVDVITGYILAIGIAFVINWAHDVDISIWKNFSMTACYTAVSMIRKYVIRRFFNKLEKNKNEILSTVIKRH